MTLKTLRSTLEFDVDSKKQSLLPNPSAARHNFCCSLWTVAVHCRTTSSSYQKTNKTRTAVTFLTRQDLGKHLQNHCSTRRRWSLNTSRIESQH